ncbi:MULTISPECIES: WG repeat-containing protein [unclassified Chryseobacterium]|uniref:WG repeat-containing protein n=1 Tax=unclassified Chryseobacterium TaxID=2593645 RepID=UPI00226AA73B|nr:MULTISPECIES: WG repeat-containing protein [unclassified Chryseobacterium]
MKNIIFLFFAVFISYQSKSQEKLDFSNKNISTKEVDKETGWMRISLKNPNKWGFINKDSLVMIPFEYDFLNPFTNGLAYAENNNQKYFITKQNLRLKGDYDEIRIFSEGLAAIKKNGKWGFIDNRGDIVIPIQYEHANYFSSNGLCAVGKNGKSGFINRKGAEIIPIVYDKVSQEEKDDNVIVNKNGKWAVFDNEGKQLTDFIYTSFKRAYITDFSKDVFTRDQSTFFENGAALAERDNKYEFINKRGQAAFSNNKFDYASVFDTFKNAIVKRNRRYGIIKTDGSFKVPLEYDFIEYFDDNHSFSEYYNAKKGKVYHIFNKELKEIGQSFEPVYNDFSNNNPTLTYKNLKGRIGIVDWRGNILVPFEYDNLIKIEKTRFLLAQKGELLGVISEEGKVKIPLKYKVVYALYDKFDEEYQLNKNLFIADGTVIDINNNVVIGGYNSVVPVYYDHNILIVSKNKKLGIIDINKNNLLPLEYDEISNWVEYGPEKKHFIKKNGKYGLIDQYTFKIVIPPIYDKFVQRENLIFATRNSKSGILDLDNKVLCQFIFDEIKPHRYFGYSQEKNKEFYSKREGKYFLINLEGKILKEISEKEYKNNT